jgi:hypothetical protein
VCLAAKLRKIAILETVEGSSLSLEGIDDVHSGDGLSSGVLSVGDGVSDDSGEESSEDISAVLVDEEGDSLDTSSSGESSDGWLGDTFENWSVVLSGVSLGGNLTDSLSLSDSFSSFSDSSHCACDVYILMS